MSIHRVCLSVSVGGVGLELDRSSALNRISLSAPVKRGGSFQKPKDDCEYNNRKINIHYCLKDVAYSHEGCNYSIKKYCLFLF